MTSMYRILALLFLSALCLSPRTNGHSFPLPQSDSDLVGRIAAVEAREEDTLVDIARRHRVGQEAIVLAKPPGGPVVPGGGHRGDPALAIHPASRAPPRPRAQYPGDAPLLLSPSGGGRGCRGPGFPGGHRPRGWETPVAETTLVSKERDPAWYPPESIRKSTRHRATLCRSWCRRGLTTR